MTEAIESELVSEGTIPPDDFHDYIPRIREVANEELEIPAHLAERLKTSSADLLVPDSLLADCAAALLAGNLVLEGPPGTGKSSLARALAAAFDVNLYSTTAHEDWSTFEVIGRQELRVRTSTYGSDNSTFSEEIVPVDGHFTEAVIRCAGQVTRHSDEQTEAQAEWLMIDELNRAQPDRAFGELFSVLGTDDLVDVVLNHQRPGNNVMVVPRRFRVIATINSLDKQFVNSLSHGLRRRFTFLTVDIPERRPKGEAWGNGASVASREFGTVMSKASATAARRTERSDVDLRTYLDSEAVRQRMEDIFDVVEKVRYAEKDSTIPFVPIGTAPLIDTVTLFLLHANTDSDTNRIARSADWAVSAKLVPLFEVDMVSREKLKQLAADLPPFMNTTRRRIAEVASDGSYYVK